MTLIQIPPIGIELVDQRDLLAARARLYLLLARDGASSVLSGFIVDKLGNVISSRKPWQQLLTVLINSCPEIAGDAGIEYSVTLISQDVDAVNSFHTLTSPSRDCFVACAPRNDNFSVSLRAERRNLDRR
jgi:hypothetical protein